MPHLEETDMAGRGSGERELIEPNNGDKRYVRRDGDGQFKDQVDVGRSLSQDRKRDSDTKKPRNQGDKGD
jgi:hypothetical protein